MKKLALAISIAAICSTSAFADTMPDLTPTVHNGGTNVGTVRYIDDAPDNNLALTLDDAVLNKTLEITQDSRSSTAKQSAVIDIIGSDATDIDFHQDGKGNHVDIYISDSDSTGGSSSQSLSFKGGKDDDKGGKGGKDDDKWGHWDKSGSDDNKLVVSQDGEDNRAKFYVVDNSDDNKLEITQKGDDNHARVDTMDDSDDNTFDIDQVGDDNVAWISATDSNDNDIFIDQGLKRGDVSNNKAYVSLDDSNSNYVEISQLGDGSTAYLTFDNSDGNNYRVNQSINDFTYIGTTDSNYNRVVVTQN
ncbi:MAG: hypothetical protein ACK5NC_08450 [Vibrio sp.]